MCGERGTWPPYLRGDKGFIRIMLQVVKGILRTVEALKTVDGSAIMAHVEATGVSRTLSEELKGRVGEEQARRYLSYDLLTGKVTPDHLLYPWLVRQGAQVDELTAIACQPITLDIMGLNFYPQ